MRNTAQMPMFLTRLFKTGSLRPSSIRQAAHRQLLPDRHSRPESKPILSANTSRRPAIATSTHPAGTLNIAKIL